MSIDLTLVKDVSFCSRKRLLSKSTTGPNAENKQPWGAQPQLIHLQHNAYTSGAEAIMEGGAGRC